MRLLFILLLFSANAVRAARFQGTLQELTKLVEADPPASNKHLGAWFLAFGDRTGTPVSALIGAETEDNIDTQVHEWIAADREGVLKMFRQLAEGDPGSKAPISPARQTVRRDHGLPEMGSLRSKVKSLLKRSGSKGIPKGFWVYFSETMKDGESYRRDPEDIWYLTLRTGLQQKKVDYQDKMDAANKVRFRKGSKTLYYERINPGIYRDKSLKDLEIKTCTTGNQNIGGGLAITNVTSCRWTKQFWNSGKRSWMPLSPQALSQAEAKHVTKIQRLIKEAREEARKPVTADEIERIRTAFDGDLYRGYQQVSTALRADFKWRFMSAHLKNFRRLPYPRRR